MDNAVIYALLFVAGFVTGAALCYAILAQIYKHRRVRDELLKARRDATKSKRTLDRFLKTSLDMFSDLDLAHRQYAMFLKETAQRLAPLEEPVHEFMQKKYSEPSVQRREEAIEHKKTNEVKLEAEVEQTVMPTPKELQSQATNIDGQQSADIEVTETKEEIQKL